MLNLVLGIVWLTAAVGVLGYEMYTGKAILPTRLGISTGWLFLLLAGWNAARWYGHRMSRREQDALRVAQEARLRRGRNYDRPVEIDPTFDFSDKPAAPPPSRNLTDQPPSNN